MEFLKKMRKEQPCKKGCFTVYVGPAKQRFSVRAKMANHRLFVVLLEEAAMEFGYRSTGPIELPCEVDRFARVIAEIECSAGEDWV